MQVQCGNVVFKYFQGPISKGHASRKCICQSQIMQLSFGPVFSFIFYFFKYLIIVDENAIFKCFQSCTAQRTRFRSKIRPAYVSFPNHFGVISLIMLTLKHFQSCTIFRNGIQGQSHFKTHLELNFQSHLDI